MKLYDGATVKLRNGEIGKCSSNGDAAYPFTIETSTNRSTTTAHGTYYIEKEEHSRDVVEILDEFQNGELVEIGYENSDVWNLKTYALCFNGAHYFHGHDGRLIPAKKVRKIPKRGWQWLLKQENGRFNITIKRYPDEAVAREAVGKSYLGPLIKVEESEGGLE